MCGFTLLVCMRFTSARPKIIATGKKRTSLRQNLVLQSLQRTTVMKILCEKPTEALEVEDAGGFISFRSSLKCLRSQDLKTRRNWRVLVLTCTNTGHYGRYRWGPVLTVRLQNYSNLSFLYLNAYRAALRAFEMRQELPFLYDEGAALPDFVTGLERIKRAKPRN